MREEELDRLFEGHKIPDVRGPHFWRVFEHLIIDFKPDVGKVIKHLSMYIPCDSCVRGMLQYIDKKPFPDNRNDALQWIIDAHNYVNKKNGKNEYSFIEGLKAISEPIEKYLDEYNKNT